MGGIGSTRWGGYTRKPRAEESLRLTAGLFDKAFRGGMSIGSVSWSSGAQIKWRYDEPELRLYYDYKKAPVIQRIPVSRMSLASGGERFWLSCPECESRVYKLYMPPQAGLFLCRECHNISYRSAQEAGRYSGSELDKLMKLLGGLR